MALLKEDGSLDIEKINRLPIEEYMEVIGKMTNEEYKEYCSKTPINESNEPVHPIKVDYTMEEDIEKNGTVILGDFLNKLNKKYGVK